MFFTNKDTASTCIESLDLEAIEGLHHYQRLRIAQFKRNVKKLKKIGLLEEHLSGSEVGLEVLEWVFCKITEQRRFLLTATDKVRGE